MNPFLSRHTGGKVVGVVVLVVVVVGSVVVVGVVGRSKETYHI